MKQAVNIVLKLNPEIKKLRKKYNPCSARFLPHITLVSPFKFKTEGQLGVHLKKSIKGIGPIGISFEGIGKSYPFIQFRVKKGEEELLNFGKKLNFGILKDIGDKECLQYPLHMTMGVKEDRKEFDMAVSELKKMNLEFEYVVDTITLMTLKKDMSLKSKVEFELKALEGLN